MLCQRLEGEEQERTEHKKQIDKMQRVNKEKQPESVYNLEVLRSTLV